MSATLALTACVKPQTETVVQTKVIERSVPIIERPEPVTLENIKWFVVTKENLDEFIEQFEKDNGAVVFVALSVRDYEKLSLNVQELRRYLLQQNEIIVYYERSLTQ